MSKFFISLLLWPLRLLMQLLRTPFVMLGYLPILGFMLRRIPGLGWIFWPEKAVRCDLCHAEFTMDEQYDGPFMVFDQVHFRGESLRVCRRPRCQHRIQALG